MLKRSASVTLVLLAATLTVHLSMSALAECTSSCTAPGGTDQCEQCCAGGGCKACCALFTNPVKNQKCRGYCGVDGRYDPPGDDGPYS